MSYFSTDFSGPFRDLFQARGPRQLQFPDSDAESELGRPASPARRLKRVKVDIANTEGMASCGRDDKYSLSVAWISFRSANAQGKGKWKEGKTASH